MRIFTVVALVALILLSSDSGLFHPQIDSQIANCDNDSRCVDSMPPVAAPDKRQPRDQNMRGSSPSQAKPSDGSGNKVGIIISSKTGARARVATRYAARFQAYIDDLENNHGAHVLFMGGIRAGHCSASSEHPCGKALDVCQLRRGVVDPRCHLPGRSALAQIAASHGLFEGGRWCNSDYGHAQVDVTAAACGDRRVRNKSPRMVGMATGNESFR